MRLFWIYNLSGLLILIVLWYLVGVGLFVSWGFGLKSLFWVFLVKPQEWRLYVGLSGVLMAVMGYLVCWLDFREKRKELAKKKKELKEWAEYLEKVREELEAEKKRVEELRERETDLEWRIKKLEAELSRKNRELWETEERLAELKDKEKAIQEGFKRGYDEGYRKVITELRSLRAQKSAVLDLFDEIPELDLIVIQRKGMNLRRYLEVEKRRRLKGGHDGEDEVMVRVTG